MGNEQDRIKLAEAMGIEMPECGSCFGSGRVTVSPTFGSEMCCQCEGSGKDWPDPFTDANDDYAVLEWMRGLRGRGRWILFKNALAEIGAAYSCNYKTGYFAHAALKALEAD